MAAIMLLVLVSRFFYIPGYLSEFGMTATLDQGTRGLLDGIGEGALIFALLFGALMILQALYKGMREHRLELAAAAPLPAAAAGTRCRGDGRPALAGGTLRALPGGERRVRVQRRRGARGHRDGEEVRRPGST